MLRRFATYSVVVTLLVASLAPLSTFASPAASNKQNDRRASRERKLAPELEAAKTGTVRVIIQAKGRATAAQDNAVAAKGGHKRKALDSLDAFVADVPAASALSELSERDDIAYVSPDRRVRAQMDVTKEAGSANLVEQGYAGAPGFTGKGSDRPRRPHRRACFPERSTQRLFQIFGHVVQCAGSLRRHRANARSQ